MIPNDVRLTNMEENNLNLELLLLQLIAKLEQKNANNIEIADTKLNDIEKRAPVQNPYSWLAKVKFVKIYLCCNFKIIDK